MRSILHSIARGVPFLCAALFITFTHAAAGHVADDVGRKVEAGTVMVYIEYDAPYQDRISWGTGFIVGDGLIMTNAHVVGDNVPMRIYVQNRYLPATEARIVAARYDSEQNGMSRTDYHDVALLAFTPPAGARLPALSFSLSPRPGEDVFAFGYPGSDQPMRFDDGAAPAAPLAVTGGAVRRLVSGNPALVMHDALCRTGNSGGPIVNSRGEVVGMQTWSAAPDRRNVVVSFAIGSRGLAEFMQGAGYRPDIAG